MRRIRQTAIMLLAAMIMMSAAAVSEGVVRLPAVLYVDDETFMNDTSIQEVVIPEGVKYIYDNAFTNCESLREITLPSTLVEIADYAFYGCDALETVHAAEGTYAYAWAVQNGYIKPAGDFYVYPAVNDGEISDGSGGETLWRHLDGNGKELSFAVSSKAEWSVSVSYGEEDSLWFLDEYIDKVFEASDRSISFKPYDNELGRVRSATITFTSGSASKVFKVFQDPFLLAELVSPNLLAEHGIPDYGEDDDDWTPPTLLMGDIQLVWDVPAGAMQYEFYYCSPSYCEDYVMLTPTNGQAVYTLPANRLEPGTTDQHIVQLNVTDAYGHTYYGDEYRFLIADSEKAE